MNVIGYSDDPVFQPAATLFSIKRVFIHGLLFHSAGLDCQGCQALRKIIMELTCQAPAFLLVSRNQLGRQSSKILFSFPNPFFDQFAGGNITVAGAKTLQTALMAYYRLAVVFNPADLSIPPLNPKLNFAWFQLLTGIMIMPVPYITIFRHDNFFEKRRVVNEITGRVAADALTGG
jgi:hypothetical protein